MCLCRVTRWDTWELQLTFTFVKILFWLSSFPFLLFTLGGETLFTHTDPTAYNAHGRIVSPQTTGLSAYLSWLREDILNSERYRDELTKLNKQYPKQLQQLALAVEQVHNAGGREVERERWRERQRRRRREREAESDRRREREGGGELVASRE